MGKLQQTGSAAMKSQADRKIPVDFVFHPSWWFHREGISFDEDFFFHPKRRVEDEMKMEHALYERWGDFGLGADHGKKRPETGAVHLASGFLLSGMLGCDIEYTEDAAPTVLHREEGEGTLDPEKPFETRIYKKFLAMQEALKSEFGYISGDVNWGGILNLALDFRGQNLFVQMFEDPESVSALFETIAVILERFTSRIQEQTKSTSISVNRNIRNIDSSIFLHSCCSHTMISVDDYEKFLYTFDERWSRTRVPFGIHYCGSDPHRYGDSFSKLPRLDFLDVGWGGDVGMLRKMLPRTFLNLRLNPVEIGSMSKKEINDVITELVNISGDPFLTGVCCINIDNTVPDEKITAVLSTVEKLRTEMEDNIGT